jgi:hypothetical protein
MHGAKQMSRRVKRAVIICAAAAFLAWAKPISEPIIQRKNISREQNTFSKLERALKDKDVGVRIKAVNALRKMSKESDRHGKRIASILCRALDDDSVIIQLSSIQVLGLIRERNSIGKLSSVLSSENSLVAAAAAKALGRIKSRKSVAPLITALSDTRVLVRNAAADALGEIGRIAHPALKKAREDRNKEVAWLAGRALGLPPEPILPDILLKSASEIRRLFGENKMRLQILGNESVRSKILSELRRAGIAPNLDTLPLIAYTGSVENACGSKKVACHLRQTNLIVINRGRMEKHTLDHEISHYINWLTSNGDIFYNKKGKAYRRREIEWLNEGMAEAISLGLLRMSDIYPQETNVVLELLKLVGPKTIRYAFYSGNYREIQERTDSKYGHGTFERVMEAETAKEAMGILR